MAIDWSKYGVKEQKENTTVNQQPKQPNFSVDFSKYGVKEQTSSPSVSTQPKQPPLSVDFTKYGVGDKVPSPEKVQEIKKSFQDGVPKIVDYVKGVGDSFRQGVERRKTLPKVVVPSPSNPVSAEDIKSGKVVTAPSGELTAYSPSNKKVELPRTITEELAYREAEREKILPDNAIGQAMQNMYREADRFLLNNPVGSFITRFGQSGAQTLGQAPFHEAPETGSKVADTVADVGGTIGSVFVNPGGVTSISPGQASIVGQVYNNPAVQRLSQSAASRVSNPTASRVVNEAVREGITGAVEGGAMTLARGGSEQEALQNALLGGVLGGSTGAALPLAEQGVRRLMSPRQSTRAAETPVQKNITPERVNAPLQPETSLRNAPNADDGIPKGVFPDPEPAPSVNQSWFEKLFGLQGVGITSGSKNPKEMIDTHIVSRPRQIGSILERISDFSAKTNQEFVDRFSPFKLVSKETYDAAMDSTRANNLANITIRDKFVDLEGNVLGKSLKEVYDSVPRGYRHIADRYTIMRDAVDRMDRGLRVYGDEPWFPQTAEEAASLVKELENRYPWLRNFGQNWNEFIRNREKLWVDSGITSQDLVDTLRKSNPNYAPMFRQQDRSGIKSKFSANKSGFSGQKAPIKRAQGSSKKIIEPARGMIETTGASYHAMLRNRAMMNIYDAVQADPNRFKGIIDIVEETAEMKQSTINQLNKVLEEEGPESVANLLNDEITNIFKRAKQSSGDSEAIVTVMVRGEPVKMKVSEPSLLKAIEGISPEQLGAITKVFNTLSRGIKYAATGGLAPIQGLKLAIRDLPIAIAQSRDKKRFLSDISHALVSQIGDWLPDFIPGSQRLGNLARQYYRAGGGYEAYLKGDSRLHQISSDLTKDPILSGRNLLKTARRVNPFRALKAFGDAMENIPRIAAFSAEMRKNGWKRDPEIVRRALDAGREATVNWSRRGSRGAEIESFLPYSNAAVQGTYRLLKRFKEQPISAIALIMGIAGAKIASYEQNKDDPAYQQRSKYEKGIVIGKTEDGKYRTIPVEPTEAFIADQILHFYKWATGGEQVPSLKENIQEGADSLLPKYLSGPISTFTSPDKVIDVKSGFSNLTGGSAFEPVNALVTGQNFFGGDIVPREYQGLPTAEQYNETTSAAGRWAAENLGIDAFTFDYIAEKFGGDLAKVGLPMTSEIGKGDPFGNITDEVLTRLKLLEDPVMKNNISNEFYSYLNSVSQAKEANSRRNKPLPNWYQQAYDQVTSYKKSSLNTRISELNRVKKSIQLDTSLSAKERSEQLREVQYQMNLLRIMGIKRLEELGVPKTGG